MIKIQPRTTVLHQHVPGRRKPVLQETKQKGEKQSLRSIYLSPHIIPRNFRTTSTAGCQRTKYKLHTLRKYLRKVLGKLLITRLPWFSQCIFQDAFSLQLSLFVIQADVLGDPECLAKWKIFQIFNKALQLQIKHKYLLLQDEKNINNF